MPCQERPDLDLDLASPELLMPMLPLPHQGMDCSLKSEWPSQSCYEAGILLGGPISQGVGMNREARVLRCAHCTPFRISSSFMK